MCGFKWESKSEGQRSGWGFNSDLSAVKSVLISVHLYSHATLNNRTFSIKLKHLQLKQVSLRGSQSDSASVGLCLHFSIDSVHLNITFYWKKCS